MDRVMRRSPWIFAALIGATTVAGAQAPRPPAPQPPPTTPTRTGVTVPTAAAQPPADGRPTEAELGVPLYPNVVYLRSYDAGRGQRYHIFGSTVPFAEMVTYYRNVLKEKGDVVFEVPPTHAFEIGRFREETMAFPPGVTVKDYTFSGSAGYPNPTPGAQPERFPTLVQIVSAPVAARK
jgi:hypothetical protein